MVKYETGFQTCVNAGFFLDIIYLIFNEFNFRSCVNHVSAIAGGKLKRYLCTDVSVMTLICENHPRD